MTAATSVERVVTDPLALAIEQQLMDRHDGRGDDAYLAYLADRQDCIISANPTLWGAADNPFALDYLRRHGLVPRHRLLDVGCGTLAAGKHLIAYLETQRYVGIDISKKSIDLAWTILQRDQRRLAKGPALHLVPGTDLSLLYGLSFDFVWAQSVLTHSAPPTVKAVLSALRPFVKVSGVFLANFSRVDQGIVQTQLHQWSYPAGFVTDAAASAGFSAEILDDWAHPFDYLNPNPHGDTMVRLTPQ